MIRKRMARWLVGAALAAALTGSLLAGCGGLSSLTPDASSGESGGGMLEQSGGGIQTIPAPVTNLTPLAQPPGLDIPETRMSKLWVGGSLQRGGITLTLRKAQPEGSAFQLEYDVAGLPKAYTPAPDLDLPYLQLDDGRLVQPVSSGGGGVPAEFTGRYTFPSLPGGTQAFTLAIPNAWTGTRERWVIPVSLIQ